MNKGLVIGVGTAIGLVALYHWYPLATAIGCGIIIAGVVGAVILQSRK